MRIKHGFVAVAVCGLGLLGGCLGAASRTNNQGGGSLLSAVLKYQNLTALNPDEIQIVTDFIIENVEEVPEQVEPLTDDQAAAVVEFIDDNNLNTVAAVQALIDNPGDVVISDNVRQVLEAMIEADLEEMQAAAEQP